MAAYDEALAAIGAGDDGALARLLDGNPALATTNEGGVSLIMLACYHRQPALAEMIAARKNTLDVFEAAALGRVEQLAALCRGPSSRRDDFSSDGFQPLHLAAFFAHANCVSVLLQAGADANTPAKNASGVRPIHSAVAGRNHDVVRLLMDRGAELNVKQHGGWTPLHAAALHGDAALVQIFLDAGADPATESDDGKTALALALSNDHLSIAALLERSRH
jgi:ankyrin repeat protein